MRKFALVILVLFAAVNAWADTAYVGDYKWEFTVINGCATIDRVSPIVGTGSTNPLTIPSSLEEYPVTHIGHGAFAPLYLTLSRVTIPNGVVSIGSGAFSSCGSLRWVSIPDSVKSIGSEAFKNCHRDLFDTATIPGVKLVDGWAVGFTSALTGDVDLIGVRGVSEYAFSGSDGLSSVTIPSNVTIISAGTFANCSNLVSVTMSSTVTRIGDYAFQNCSSLTNAMIPDSMMSIGYHAFFGCNETLFDAVTIPGVKLLGGWAVDYTDSMPGYLDLTGACGMARKLFYDCGDLKSIKIPDGVASIDDSCFYGSGLMSIQLPNGLTNISDSAFCGCSALTSIKVPSSTTHIGNSAFYGCSNLMSVQLETGVMSIDDSAFYGCSSLASIKIPDSVTRIGDFVFYGCTGLMSVQLGNGVMEIGESAFYGCSGFSGIVIPGSVTNIGVSAFYNCNGMTSVRLSEGVVNIENQAFYGCDGLKSMMIPDSVTQIGTNAFCGCNGLTNVVIGHRVKVICGWAFQNCNKLTDVVIPNNVEKIGSSAFLGCSELRSMTLPFVGAERGNNGIEALFGFIFGRHISYTTTQYYSSSEYVLYDIPRTLKSVVIADETALGYGAFYWCNGLTNLVVNQGIGHIGDKAFCNCSGLLDFKMPDSVNVIGPSAFEGCANLPEITVPDGVSLIGRGAFSGCTSLVKVTLPFVGSARGNEDTADSVFGHIFGTSSYSGGAAITQYFSPYEYATYYIPTSLKSVVITGETLLGCGAFYGCSGLVDVSLSESVESIGVSAFSGCENLESIIFKGDAPVATGESFDGIPDSCKGRVAYGSDGWGEAIPCQWNGLTIEYVSSIVVFDANGGTGGAELDLAVGAEIVAPTVERTGYSFAGWEPCVDEIVPSTNVTYVAQWEADDFEVSFDAAGGVLQDANSKIVRYDGMYGELPTPTREGYAFSGWVLNSNLVTATTIMTTACDHVLIAEWTPEQYLVTFNANGGIGGCAGYQDYASAIVAPMVTRVGYSFVEWWPNVAATVPRSDVAYTAQWAANVYSVHFDANGGNGEMVDVEMTYDESFPLSTNEFTRQDYAFMGWARSSDGAVEFEDSQSISNLTENAGGIVTLYAVWESTKVADPMISPVGGPIFIGKSCEVSITCETEDATIYYSTKGATPRQTSAYMYTGPFTITNSSTIKAVAVKGNRKSEYVTLMIEKITLTLAGAAGADGLVFSTGGTADWSPTIDATSESGFSARSGTVGLESETWMETTVDGAGTFAFSWKVDCEWDESGDATWDRLAIFTNGVEVARIDGTTGWKSESFVLGDGGSHVIRWVFSKDDYDEPNADYADCAWISGVVWMPSAAIPAVAIDADVVTVNATVDEVGFADAAVKAAIGGSAEEYNALKTWAGGVKGTTGDALAGEAAVVANAHAAAAYLLGAERLFENEPTVEIGALAIGNGESAGTSAMTVAVTVKDGESAVAVSAAKVAAMFEATGDLGDWTGAAKLTPTVTTSGTDANGKMTFVVTPGDGTASKAFLRIKR